MPIKNTRYSLTSRLGGGSGFQTLNMTAMIDVIFLLLIFFLVAAKFRPVEDFLPVNVPSQRGGQSSIAVEPLEIFVEQADNACKVAMGNETVEITDSSGRDSLRSMLENVLKSQGRFLSDPVEIVCGEDVLWQNIVGVYDMLYGAGLGDISFRLVE
jgi:biopolymer transport protein ExbD